MKVDPQAYEQGDAYLSEDRTYRYALSRCWDPHRPMMLVIGLNPSTADETVLDPTLRRCVRFAIREKCGGLWMGNLFALRATDPVVMKASFDPVGPDNDRWLLDMARWSDLIVCAWGTHGGWLGRDDEVKKLLDHRHLHCLGVTKAGHPRHPLYLPSAAPLVEFGQRPFLPGAR